MRHTCQLSAWTMAVILALPAVPGRAQPVAQPFTLAEALARARDASPEHAAATARLEAARLAAPEAGRRPNPVIEVRSENWFSGVPRATLPLDTFAEVTQPIEIAGKRAARRAVADAAVGVEAAAADAVRLGIARDVARIYLEALRYRERERTLAGQAADLAELVRVVGRRVDVGAAAESELLKLQAEEARAGLEQLRSDVAARRLLAELSARLGLAVALDALIAPAPPAVVGGEPAAALARRPDIAAANRALEAARQTLRLERARGVPDPSVNGGLKRTAGVNTAQVTVTMALPIFNRNQQARVLAEGQLRAAELDRAAVERRALGELQATREVAERLVARARGARQALVEPARAARAAARAAFTTGAIDVMRLLDAERAATDAALVATDLEIDAVIAAIEARLAAGEEPLP